MVDETSIEGIFRGLRSQDSSELMTTCTEVKSLASNLTDPQIRIVADGVRSLFYHDAVETLEYSPVLDCAIEAFVALGPKAIPVLIEDLADSDLHINILIARTLSRMGQAAAHALIDEFLHSNDPYEKNVALFALSLMDDPVLIGFFPEVVRVLDGDNPELRDTAARAIGKMAECFGGTCLSPEATKHAFDKLLERLADSHGGARSKAVESIGKLAKAGMLNDSQKETAIEAMEAILGIDGHFSWDPAFIVRREAERAYYDLTGQAVEVSGPCGMCNRKGPDCAPASK